MRSSSVAEYPYMWPDTLPGYACGDAERYLVSQVTCYSSRGHRTCEYRFTNTENTVASWPFTSSVPTYTVLIHSI